MFDRMISRILAWIHTRPAVLDHDPHLDGFVPDLDGPDPDLDT